MRVLITGATGFVGSWMRKKTPPGVEVVGFNRSGYESNILEHTTPFTHIVHLAPVSPFKVIELAHKLGARLLYCSSGIVYYKGIDTEYRLHKIADELFCKASGVDVVIARLFTFFGDMHQPDKAITAFFDAARAGNPLKVYGDGSCVRSYMHGAEMGRQMWRILFEGESGKVYDVGSRRPQTMKRLAERIQAFTGCEIEYIDADIPMKEYYPKGENGIMDRN